MSKTMQKYEPLGVYLRKNAFDRISLTFDEIEGILGLQLPASKNYQAWWSNNPNNNQLTRQWLDAGYQTELVDMASRKLVFQKIVQKNFLKPNLTPVKNDKNENLPLKPFRHPAFGCMEGTVTIEDGVDLTEPACPEWEQIIEEKYSTK